MKTPPYPLSMSKFSTLIVVSMISKEEASSMDTTPPLENEIKSTISMIELSIVRVDSKL